MIKQIEDAIIQRVKSEIAGLAVESFPLEGEYRLRHPLGAILVRYLGSKYDSDHFEIGGNAAQALDEIPENRSLQFELRLFLRNLKSHQAAHEKIQQILNALTGFIPAPAQELLPLQDGLLKEQDGVWQFYIQFKTSYP